MFAVALIAVVALGAVVLSNRSSSTAAGEPGVEPQPESTTVEVPTADVTETDDDGLEPDPSPTSVPASTLGPVMVNGEMPLQALQARVLGEVSGAGEEGTGGAGPFCFQADTGTGFLGADETVYEQRVIAQLDMTFDGTINVVTYQTSEVSALLSARTTGNAEGVFNVDFDIVSGEGAAWGDTVTHSVEVTNDSFSVRGTRMHLVACADIQSEVDSMLEIDDRIRGQVLEGYKIVYLDNVEPAVWEFVTGPVNLRATPGLGGEILGTWDGNESNIVGTGGRARADGFIWVRLAESATLPEGWVELAFIRPSGTLTVGPCFDGDGGVMSLRFSEDATTFVGGVRGVIDGQVTHVAVAGLRFEGSRFNVRSQVVGSDVVESQEWDAFGEGVETPYGPFWSISCPERMIEVTEIDRVVIVYPPLPG